MATGDAHDQMLKKILVNRYEQKTFALLKKQADGEQAQVCPKVGLKDVFPFENANLPRELHDFCWRAHFDFVLTDAESAPLFAVEFDGTAHQTPVQQERDRKKDELCRIFFLPILRINSRYLAPAYRGTDLLSWFAECFFTHRAFLEAEQNGWLSPEEGFDPMSVASIGDRHDWPLDLSHEVRESFRKLRMDGRTFDDQPSFFIGKEESGTYRAFAVLAITENRGVFASTAMRAQQFEISQADALEILIYFEIFEALKKVLTGGTQPEPLTALMERMERSCQGLQPSRAASMNSAWTTRSMFGKKP
jgi:hypothetical protein